MKYMFLLFLLLSNSAYAKTMRIAVFDTGFDRSLSHAPLCPDATPLQDSAANRHGTNVADLIAQNAGKGDYCLLPFSIFVPDYNRDGYVGLLHLVAKMHVDVINMSFAGQGYDADEAAALKVLLDQGVIIMAAAGNVHSHLNFSDCRIYPACDDRRIVVVGTYSGLSGFGDRISMKTRRDSGCIGDSSHCLTGTSQATAIETGRFVRRLLDK
jgi:hypothetical protein